LRRQRAFSRGAAVRSADGENSVGSGHLGWRDDWLSDWEVSVGEETYQLHAVMLARASSFFRGNIRMAARGFERHSNLTELLPQSCLPAFELALDFIYSPPGADFVVPRTQALYLLKVADVLGIDSLAEAVAKDVERKFVDFAPHLMQQYFTFHLPGTDDGPVFLKVRNSLIHIIVRRFGAFLVDPVARAIMLSWPVDILAAILGVDELRVAHEDDVFDFVSDRMLLLAHGATLSGEEPVLRSVVPAGSLFSASDGEETANLTTGEADQGALLWNCVRTDYLSAEKMKDAALLGEHLGRPDIIAAAFDSLVMRASLSRRRGFPVRPRRPLLPAWVRPPMSNEIDFCFHYGDGTRFTCEEELRSRPKRIGDMVVRLLAYPAGEDNESKGFLSVFIAVVPQPTYPPGWSFNQVRYTMSCLSWLVETPPFEQTITMDFSDEEAVGWGWPNFIQEDGMDDFISPDGFVCLRAAIHADFIGQTFLRRRRVRLLDT